jgi:hypothetical protein
MTNRSPRTGVLWHGRGGFYNFKRHTEIITKVPSIVFDALGIVLWGVGIAIAYGIKY